MSHVIGVDVGGTQMRAARFKADLTMVGDPIKRESPHHQDEFLRALFQLIRDAIAARSGAVTGLGVALPGPIDHQTGMLISPPNLPFKGETPIQRWLEEQFSEPVFLGNDADLAALGEFQKGAGRGSRHMIYITVSTGVGGGVIIDGKLNTGQGLGGEVGHIVVEPDGPVCGCGHRGHLEAVSSGTAIANLARARIAAGETSLIQALVDGKPENISASVVAEAGRRGDALALDLLNQAGRYLGVAMASLMMLLNPERFVLGGGVMKSYDLLQPSIDKALGDYLMTPRFLRGTLIEQAQLGDDAGLYGAAALALLRLQES